MYWIFYLIKILAYKKIILKIIHKFKGFNSLTQPNSNRLKTDWFGLGFNFFY